jgi:large subunit ribosomal protein L9
MELILLETVEGLGRPGDQVKVRPGYARNFLLPRRKAVPLSADVLRNLSKLKAKAEAEERAMISTMEDLAKRISGFQVQIPARATEEGHLFGSVTDKDVHAALGVAGWTLPLRAVRMLAHLKEAGLAEVPLHLHGEITATIRVEVVPVDSEGNKMTVVAPAPEPVAAAPVEAADEDGEDQPA